MEFSLICPTDGRIDLGLEDISAVVFRGPDSVQVLFECPHCHAPLRTQLRVPNLLGAAMELARHNEDASDNAPRMLAHDLGKAEELEDERVRAERERAGEAYCEYFRRQLAGVESVEDLLGELG